MEDALSAAPERTVSDIIAPAVDRWRDQLRVPSPEMLAAPVHVALATFSQPRADLPSGRVIAWVFVVDVLGQQPEVHGGHTESEAPTALILAGLSDALALVEGDVWISLPKKRAGLANSLRNAGYAVTVGLGVGSRSEMLLREQLTERALRAQREAAAFENAGVQASAVSKPVTTRTPQGEAKWWPSEWRVGGTLNTGHLLIATDASMESVDYSRSYAICAVSDENDCLLNSGYTQEQIGCVELEAIVAALQLVAARAPTRATIMSDSMAALKHAETLIWRRHIQPPVLAGEDGAMAVQSRFLGAWQAAAQQTDVRLKHVRGHSGNPLNETADAIASAARKAAMIPRQDSERVLTRYIDQRLQIAKATRTDASLTA